MKPEISVIIPVWHEAARINATLDHLFALNHAEPMECIVVDGGARGDTLQAVKHPRVRTLRSPRGRGVQMNRGAAVAAGSVYLFLHADTRLAPDALIGIRRAMARPGIVGGAFDLGIDSPRKAYRLIETVASARSRLTRVPYGDQAIFVRSAVFHRLGGYREIELMEDVDLMRRIQRAGWRIVILKQRVHTSPRRWEKEGVIFATLRNWALVTLYLMGWSASKLKKYYR